MQTMSQISTFKIYGADSGGVGQAHVHYKALTKIFLLNLIIPFVASNYSHNNGCIVIIDGYCYC